jgi:hypothetical protein
VVSSGPLETLTDVWDAGIQGHELRERCCEGDAVVPAVQLPSPRASTHARIHSGSGVASKLSSTRTNVASTVADPWRLLPARQDLQVEVVQVAVLLADYSRK